MPKRAALTATGWRDLLRRSQYPGLNPLSSEQLLHAGDYGEVLVEHRPGDGLAWIEAPPFTADLKYAESLLPEGLLTFFRDARRVCATALQARALANEPPLPSGSNIMKLRGG
jgi:hypothetical protein